MEFDPDYVGVENGYYGTRQGGVDVGSGTEEARDHSHVVTDENVKGQRAYQREQVAALFSGNTNHEFLDAVDHNLEDILPPLWNQFDLADRKFDQDHQTDKDHPGIGHIGEE